MDDLLNMLSLGVAILAQGVKIVDENLLTKMLSLGDASTLAPPSTISRKVTALELACDRRWVPPASLHLVARVA